MSRAETRPSGLRPFRLAAIVLGALVLVVAAVIGITAAILLSGSTEIGMIRDRAEAALSERLGPAYAVDVGRATMGIDADLGLVVDLSDIKVAGQAGTTAISVPLMRLAIDPLPLLGFRLAVSEVTLDAPTVALLRDASGRYAFEGGPRAVLADTGSDDPLPGLPYLASRIADFDGLIADTLAGSGDLVRVEIVDGTVTIRDAVSGNTRRIGGIAVDGRIEGPEGALAVDARAIGEGGPWSATLRRHVDDDSGAAVLSAGVAQMTLSDVIDGVSGMALGDVPFYAQADVVVDDRGMRDAMVRLDVGAGVLDLGDPEDTLLLDEATVRARWDGAAGEIVIEPSSVHFGPTGGTFTGAIRDEGAGRYAFAFGSDDTVLAARDTGLDPLPVSGLELSGSADIASRRLDIDRLVIKTEDGAFAGAMRLGFTGETPSLAVAAELTPMPVATWLRMWPTFLAPGARAWVIDNIRDGRITAARLDTAVPAGVMFRPEPPQLTPEQFRLNLTLADVTVETYGGLPPVRRASGQASLSGGAFGLDVTGGEAVTPSGAVVKVTDAAFAIDDVFAETPIGAVEAGLSGTAAAMGELADAEPFAALSRRGIAPADLSGTAQTTVSLRVPLNRHADEDPVWKVVVNGTGLASRTPVEGRVFRGGDLVIVVAPSGVSVDGTAEIDGVKAAVSFSQPLAKDGGNAPGARQSATLSLDAATRRQLGLDIEDIVSGSIDTKVETLPGGRGDRYVLDLRPARLVLPGLGWSKGVGVPASLSFDLLPVDGGARIENMELAGEGFGFVGTAEVSSQEGLVSADLRKVRLRTGDDIAVKVALRDGGYVITVDGASFDIRGAIAELKGDVEAADSGSGSTDFTVDARVRKLRGYNDRAINDAQLTFALTDGIPSQLTVNGKLGGPLSLAYTDAGSRASIQATAANAGAVFDFLDVYGRIGGGRLTIGGERPAPTGPLAGTISLTDFSVLNEPAVGEVVSRAKARKGEKVDTAKMHIDQMDAVFRYTGDALFIDDAFLRGASMGAVFSGMFDLVASTVAMSGTYIPLFGINSAVSKVPVVGRILGGENGEGLIGVTFKVEGSIDSPRVSVNPLSAVTPGILRKVFEFKGAGRSGQDAGRP